MEELKSIMTKFAASGWDLIAIPAQQWLDGKSDKNTLVSAIKQADKECGYSLDEQYKKYGNTENFFGRVIEPGQIYEVGYPKCVCPEVLSGKTHDKAHCECSRQSTLNQN